MSGQRTLTRDKIIMTSANITEKQGYANLNLNAIAAALGIKPPSLYNHVGGIEDVQRKLAEAVLTRMEEAVRNAAVGRSEKDALREIAYAYRRFAVEHPELYRAFTNAPALGGELAGLADTLRSVLRPFALPGRDETNFIRSFHSALYGFVSLEQTGFFKNGGEAVEDSFAAVVEWQLAILNSIGGTSA
jgi:AcrR family transcriptional regulator